MNDDQLLATLLRQSPLFQAKTSLKTLVHSLPYVLRLHVLDFVSVKATRFFFDMDRYTNGQGDPRVCYLYSYEIKDYIGVSFYIKLLYGYFPEDYSRKIYLIFGYLVFRSNRFLQYLPKRNMRQLYVLNGGVPRESMKNVPDNLTSLCFSDINIILADMLELVGRCKKLWKFAIQRIGGMNSPELMKLLQICSIIRIMNCQLDDKCVSALFESTNLTNINLNNNDAVTSLSTLALPGNTKLVHYRLNNTSIGDQALDVVLNLPQIHEVQMSRTKVTQGGFWKLIENHEHLRIIEAMDLCMIDYPYAGRNQYLKERESTTTKLRGKWKLEMLYFDCTPITLDTLRMLAHTPNLTFVSLINTRINDRHVRFVLNNFRKIDTICLGHNLHLTTHSVMDVAKCKRLKKVEYCQERLTEQQCMILFQSPSIQHLFIQGNDLTDKSLNVLKVNNALKVLQVSGSNHRLTETGYDFLKTNTQIEELITGTEERPVNWIRDKVL